MMTAMKDKQLDRVDVQEAQRGAADRAQGDEEDGGLADGPLEAPLLPRSPAMPTEPAPASMGMASSPLPMKPSANSALAKWPAKGLSASAAWGALWMLVLWWLCRVWAVATMMANMTRSENVMPVKTSRRLVACLRRARRGLCRLRGCVLAPAARCWPAAPGRTFPAGQRQELRPARRAGAWSGVVVPGAQPVPGVADLGADAAQVVGELGGVLVTGQSHGAAAFVS